MSISSTPLAAAKLPQPSRPVWRDAVELLSSMRFSISLLSLICIASIIGTVIKQAEPYNNYVNQFGPFWAEVFNRVGLYTVYSVWWFLLILGFLVVSVSLCIARNAPKIIAELKTYKEHVRERSLESFHHKVTGSLPLSADASLAHVSHLLSQNGWRARAQVRDNGTMVAARKGMANKLGYLCAHSSIVLICLGGLLDGDLVVRAQMALLGKSVLQGGGLIADVKPEHRLSERNPTFRANLLVTEGGRAGVAVLNMADGVVLQDLPIEVELKKFIVEYYDTGMPKLFASDIVIHDRATGEQVVTRVKVNEPAKYKGITLYQSSFDDGGSSLELRGLPLDGAGKPFMISGTVGASTSLSRANSADQYTLEFAGLRVINVENMGGNTNSGTDVRKVDLASSLDKHLGSGGVVNTDKNLRNVGPSVSYRLRDASGQAREYNNYMLPMDVDGQRVILAGVKESLNEPMRYMRIPVDEQDAVDGWWRMLAALRDPAQRELAVKRYVAQAAPADRPQMAEQLFLTAQRALGLFAGSDKPPTRQPGQAGTAENGDEQARGGLPSLAQFVESTVPEPERARISEVLLRIVNGCLFELANLSREQAGLAPLQPGETTQRFMTQAVLALSDAAYYPAPVLLQLNDFKQIQASVFQVTRAPGKTLVYLGAVLLIIGVFTMLYIRERRLWIWLQSEAPGSTRVQAALSTTRRTMDIDAEFDQLKLELMHVPQAPQEKA